MVSIGWLSGRYGPFSKIVVDLRYAVLCVIRHSPAAGSTNLTAFSRACGFFLPIHLYCALLLLPGVSANLCARQVGQAEIEKYSQQAEQALSEKNWDGAAKALERLSLLAPKVPEVQANLGLAYYSQGRILEAAQAFQRALKLNPQMARAERMLGLCFAELGRNQEAVSVLEPAFRHPPDNQMGRLIGLDLERAYAGLHQYARAAAVFDILLSRYPNDPEILFHASRLYADRAYQLIQRLMQEAPDSVWVHYATAEVHESLQHYDLATREYRTVLEMEPRLPGVHFRLGQAILLGSRDSKAVSEAIHEFEQELTIAPENADAEYELGEIDRERGQFDQSLEHFSKAVRYQPQFEEAQIGLSRALISLNRPREALAHLREAVRLNPQNEVSHFLLASVHKALGETTEFEHELALFQKLHAAGLRSGLRLPSASAPPKVTRQELDPQVKRQP
jgi:tetratricopeptide (TPR) repeat protein